MTYCDTHKVQMRSNEMRKDEIRKESVSTVLIATVFHCGGSLSALSSGRDLPVRFGRFRSV